MPQCECVAGGPLCGPCTAAGVGTYRYDVVRRGRWRTVMVRVNTYDRHKIALRSAHDRGAWRFVKEEG